MRKTLITTLAILTTVGLGYGVVQAFSPQYGINNGLVGYWSLDTRHTPWTSSTAATTIDMSGNGNTGTLTNMARATAPIQGKMGQALNFDGVNDYVTIGDHAALKPTSFTVGLWVKLNSNISGNRALIAGIAGSSGYEIIAGSGNTVWWAHTKNFAINNTSKSLALNTWTHIVMVYDETSGTTVYADGVSVSTDSATGAMTYSGAVDLRIAGRSDQSNWLFPGVIDDVRIYNRALSAAEVQQLYRMGTNIIGR